jgi:hypothetical protein
MILSNSDNFQVHISLRVYVTPLHKNICKTYIPHKNKKHNDQNTIRTFLSSMYLKLAPDTHIRFHFITNIVL